MNNFNYKNLSVQLEVFKNHPSFIAGFTDGEGCFTLGLSPSKVQALFQINLQKGDKALLENIQKALGVGHISPMGDSAYKYQVGAIKDLAIRIKYFDSYRLITNKRADYLLFKQAVSLIAAKKHLSQEGFKELLAIKASLNQGLSSKLQEAYPGIVPFPRPSVDTQIISDPYWLAGFVNAEGCFSIDLRKASAYKSGYQVRLRFRISQHIRDHLLMQSLTEYLGCGKIEIYPKGNAVNFSVLKFEDIITKIIPFFKEYPIVGIKATGFEKFCKAADLLSKGQHLSPEGLEKIRQIKSELDEC